MLNQIEILQKLDKVINLIFTDLSKLVKSKLLISLHPFNKFVIFSTFFVGFKP